MRWSSAKPSMLCTSDHPCRSAQAGLDFVQATSRRMHRQGPRPAAPEPAGRTRHCRSRADQQCTALRRSNRPDTEGRGSEPSPSSIAAELPSSDDDHVCLAQRVLRRTAQWHAVPRRICRQQGQRRPAPATGPGRQAVTDLHRGCRPVGPARRYGTSLPRSNCRKASTCSSVSSTAQFGHAVAQLERPARPASAWYRQRSSSSSSSSSGNAAIWSERNSMRASSNDPLARHGVLVRQAR